MTRKKGWGTMTKEERSVEMLRRRQVARDKKSGVTPQSNGLASFIDDPTTALQHIDARVLHEQETIKDAEAKIAIAKLKIQRLDALRKVLTDNNVDAPNAQ